MRKETIGEKLDRLTPVKCVACDTPYKRTAATLVHGHYTVKCIACGLDQNSAEAYAIWHQLQHQAVV